MNFNKVFDTSKAAPPSATATNSITEKQRQDEEWDIQEGGEEEENPENTNAEGSHKDDPSN